MMILRLLTFLITTYYTDVFSVKSEVKTDTTYTLEVVVDATNETGTITWVLR